MKISLLFAYFAFVHAEPHRYEEEDPDAMWLIISVIVAVISPIIIIIWMRLRKHYRNEHEKMILIPAEKFEFLRPMSPDLNGANAQPMIDDPAELLPYDGMFEFPQEQLILGERIQSGKFGMVKKAEARVICKSGTVTTTVRVKSFEDFANPLQAMTLACNLKILAYHGRHLNVFSLLGACTTNISYAHGPSVITGFYRFGNLRDYLWNRRAQFINHINTVTAKVTAESSRCTNCLAADFSSVEIMNCDISSVTEIICSYCTDSTNRSMTLTSDQGVFNYQTNYESDTRDLLTWAWQLAHGMKYLGSKAILPGDFSARNIFLSDGEVVKICDFGLAKILCIDGDAQSEKRDFISVPWSAIESMKYRVLFLRSDIWFYGIVLWDFFDLGEAPHDKKELETLYNELVDGVRLKQSKYATQGLYEIILHERPSKLSHLELPLIGPLHWNYSNISDESESSHYIKLSGRGVQPYFHALEHSERDLSSIRPPEQQFGGTDFQLGTDASEQNSFEGYLSESQLNEISGDFNVLVDNDAPEHDSSEDYLTESQLDEEGPSIFFDDYVPMSPVYQTLEDPYAEQKIGDPAELLTYDNKWEFPRDQLILGESIGSGKFGNVRKAEARFICRSEAITTVAVKSIMDTKNSFQAKIIDREIKILAHLGKHLNVVSLLVACNANISSAHNPLMILEFCRFGNLREYLRNRKTCFINQIDTVTGKIAAGTSRTNYVAAKSSSVDRMNCGISSVTGDTYTHSRDATHESLTLPSDEGAFNHQKDNGDENDDPIYTRDLLCWAWQVAHGMKYLGTKGILHGDLAARNVLLADDKVVKICDFGLSKILHVDKDAENKRQEFMPILWSSIESVRDRILSVHSDIWSYGVVLWEFFSLGETPYDGKELKTLYRELVDGFRLEKPEYATQDIYEMMLHCWASEPRQRPTFNEIAKCIGNSLDESVKTHYNNLSALGVQPYVDALEYGERDLSSIRPPEQKFGGTDFQLGTDASEHDGSGSYLPESQSNEILGGYNVLVDNDAPEHIGRGDYVRIGVL